MSINHFEWACSCLKKNRYETKEMAIKIKRKSYRERRHKLRVYFCEHCNGWHVTKQIRDKLEHLKSE